MAILTCLAAGPSAGAGWLAVRDGLTWTAVGLTLYSGLAYVALAMPALKGKAAS
jgi:CDP-diacylglycerol--glycerol-3-phosphate 3-phosphatidyltransferase